MSDREWPEKPTCPKCKSGTIRHRPEEGIEYDHSIVLGVCDFCGHEPLHPKVAAPTETKGEAE